MRKVIFVIVFLLIGYGADASSYYEQLNYCSWMSNAASAVAKNRDLGIDEYSLIKLYLEQDNDYIEQVVVLSLIDRIYGPQKDEDIDMISLEAKSECLGELLSYISDSN